jgi:hypothetical protein
VLILERECPWEEQKIQNVKIQSLRLAALFGACATPEPCMRYATMISLNFSEFPPRICQSAESFVSVDVETKFLRRMFALIYCYYAMQYGFRPCQAPDLCNAGKPPITIQTRKGSCHLKNI